MHCGRVPMTIPAGPEILMTPTGPGVGSDIRVEGGLIRLNVLSKRVMFSVITVGQASSRWPE